jgi:hypothetical protein
MSNMPTPSPATARRPATSTTPIRWRKALVLMSATCLALVAVATYATLALVPRLRATKDGAGSSSASQAASDGSLTTHVGSSLAEAAHATTPLGRTATLDASRRVEGQTAAGLSQLLANPGFDRAATREDVFAAARRSNTFDYDALETALDGNLSPELRALVVRHRAESLLFERAESAYDQANAANTAAVQAGSVDPSVREALDARAHELETQVRNLQKLNSAIAARFEREVEARIAELSP